MAVAWARAEVILDANGELLPAQVRREATRAGNEGGDAASKSFADSFRKNLGPRISGMFTSLRNSLRRLGGVTNSATRSMNGFGNSLHNLSGGWRSLSANTRQWTLIVGAVIGAMSQLAGLASAAGSGIFVLAGALSGLITGGIFAGVAFARFLGDLERVPEVLLPARAAFDRFGDTVSEVMDAMTVAAFRDTERAWNRFGEVIRDLQPGFEAIGTVVNKLITDLADNLDTSTVENLNGFLAGSAKILDRVVRAGRACR